MFRTISRCLLLLCLLPIASAPQLSKAAPAALQERSSASLAAREIRSSTWCKFTAGPSAGATRNLSPQPAQTVGSTCHDSDGNSGIIIEYHPTRALPAPVSMPPPPPPPPSILPPRAVTGAVPPHPGPAGETPPPPPPSATSQSPKELDRSKNAAKPPVASAEKTGSESSPAASTPVTTTAAEPSYGQRVGDWYKQLKQGSIEYNIPQKMVWKVASTVTVVIHGYQAPKTNALSQATGSGTLKVSDRIR